MADLGVTEEVLAAVEVQTAGGGNVLDSGVFKFTLDKLFTRTTDSGAVMLHIEAHKSAVPNDKLNYATCVRSGDGKGNKTTYTAKNGKEVPLPGVTEAKRLMEALKVTTLPTTPGKEKFGENEIDVNAVLPAVGKELVLGIKIEDGEYPKNFINAYMDTEGKNGAGEVIADKIAANIAKNPVKKAKEATTQTATGATGEAPSGW